ncbi:MAG: helix-turn-helix domain-containing protein [Acidobacteriia bacterium]|nr:helix-turn-helix domain-containing protein [Terriglobia bacterium]
MTKGIFGENLKRERELRGVSLEEISTATRIATRFLRAIENEQWEQLPGGVFNRGFVRAVARFLGLDEENTVAEYAMAVDEGPTVPVWTGRPPALPPERPWVRLVLAAVAIVALLAGSWFATRKILAWRAARRAARSAGMSTEAPASLPQLRPVDAAPAPSNVPAPSLTPGFATAEAAPAPVAASPSPADPPPAAGAIPANPALLVLKISADKKTKVTIDADTDQLLSETLKAGEHRVFSAKDRFDVSARDAGALSLELNGKTLAPIGPAGKSGKITLTREALKGTPGGAN